MEELTKWLFVCLALFAIGDFLGVITKARVSSVFVALILFLVGFMTKIFPEDIISKAGLSDIGRWSSVFIVFHMGTSINMGELKKEWKTVLLSIIAMVTAMVGILLVAPIIGFQAAVVSIPVINGGIVATQIMTDAALQKGFSLAAALGTIVYAAQKFVGTPPASLCGLKEAEKILKEYREGKLKDDKASIKRKAEDNSKKEDTFFFKHKKYFTDFTCLAITGVFAYLSYLLQRFTGINYSIWALVLGATIGHFKIVPDSIMTHGKSSGLLSMACFASIIPSLAKISLDDLGTLGFQTIVVFGVTLLAIYAVMYLTPVWKLVGSKNLAIGVSMAQLLGFPATFLIANEVATAAAKNDEEKEVVLKKIMPAYVVAGFASVTSISIIIAGIFVKFL